MPIFTAIAKVATAVFSALGLGAVVITASQVFGVAASLALTIGSSILRSSSQRQQTGLRAAAAPDPGATLTMESSGNAPREMVLGPTGTGGTLQFECASGSSNEVLWRVIRLADHPTEGLAGLWIDREFFAWPTGQTGNIETFAPSKFTVGGVEHLHITLYKGGAGQAAHAPLVTASGGEWTNKCVMTSITYVVVRYVFNRNVWRGSSAPELVWKPGRALLYDIRRDSTAGGSGPQRFGQMSTYEPSNNAAVVLYNFLRGYNFGPDGLPMHGMNIAAARIDTDRAIAAMNACDELVPLRLGGTEPRYRVCGVLRSDTTNDSRIERLCAAMSGDLIDHSGVFTILPGVAQVSAMTLTDDNRARGKDLQRTEKQSPANLYNVVNGDWRDPNAIYTPQPIGARFSTADIAADGGIERSITLPLDLVASRSQGQRCLEIFRREQRYQEEFAVPFSRRALRLQAGDWFRWDSDQYGSSKLFSVKTHGIGPDFDCILNIREIGAAAYDWNPAVDEQLDNEAVDLPPGAPALTVVSGLAVAEALVTGDGGTQTPAIRVTWTPITDPTVTNIHVRYKRLEDAVWQNYLTSREQAAAGAATIVAGIIGGGVYEATAEPLTDPPRVTVRSAPATAPAVTQPVVVNRAQTSTITEQVLPGVITPDSLIADFRLRLEDPSLRTLLLQTAISLQSRIEEVSRGFNIVTGKIRSDVLLGLNPLSADITKLDQEIAEVNRQIASVSTALSAQTAGVAAALDQEIAARTNAVQAETVDRTAAVAQLADDITAIETSIALLVDENGTSATDTTRLAVQQANANTMALRAALAEAVRDGDLDRDERRRFGIVSAQVTEAREANTRQDEALAKFTLDLIAETNARTTQLAAVNTTLQALTTATSAQADQITSLTSRIGSAESVNTGQASAISGLGVRVSDAEGAIVSQAQSLTNVSARADQATAEGLMSMVAVATAAGASASFRIRLRTALNGTWRETGQRMDIMPDGSTRIEFDAGKIINRTEQLQIASPSVNSGTPIDLFSVENINGTNRFVFDRTLQISTSNIRSQFIGDMNFGFPATGNGTAQLIPNGGGATGLLNIHTFNVPAGNNTDFRLQTLIDQQSLLSYRTNVNVGDTNILNGKIPSIYIEVPAPGGTAQRIDFPMFSYVPSWPNIGGDGSPRAGGVRRALNNIPVFIPASGSARTVQIKWGWVIDIDRSNIVFDCRWFVSGSLFS
jgi:hypothetical protein